MSRLLKSAMLAASLAAPLGAHAATFTFTTLDNPADPTFNQLLGINDSGVIAGYFGSGQAGHPNQGYTVAPPYTTFVPDNLPGSVQTQATGINAMGTTTGFWSDTNLGSGDNNFGFIRLTTKKGSYEYISVNDPLVAGTPFVDQVLGINKGNNAVGFYNDSAGMPHGFAYLLANNTFTPIVPPHAVSEAATGINDSNLICGFFVNANNVTLGFVMPETNGTAIVFRVPGAPVTQLLGINDKGRTVGFYMDANQVTHGLYYNPANGMWQQVDDPNGVGGTVLNGLNNKNQLVGFYTDAAGNVHGMLVNVTP
jgi:hypothetical protein